MLGGPWAPEESWKPHLGWGLKYHYWGCDSMQKEGTRICFLPGKARARERESQGAGAGEADGQEA